VFIDETGGKERRIKRLAIMDQDGANVRYLTRGEDLVLTPRFFALDAGNHLHVLWAGGDPRVFLLNIETAKREIVGNFPGMSFSPRSLADRPAGHHEPAAGLELQHLRDGSAVQAHEHGSPTRRRSIPRRPIRPTSARICFDPIAAGKPQIYVRWRGRRRSAAFSFGEGSYSTPGVVAPGISLLHQAGGRPVLDRHHAPDGKTSGCSPPATTTKVRLSRRTAGS